MSSYINVYVKSKSNEFVELDICSRSSELYQILELECEYGKITILDKEKLNYLISVTDEKVEKVQDSIAHYITKKNFLKELKGVSLDEIMEQYSDYDCAIDECNTELSELKHVAWELQFLWDMIDNAELTAKYEEDNGGIDPAHLVYVGHECEYPKVGYNC